MDTPVELAVDQLWKYQLRREHTALLEGLKVQQKKYTAFAEEAEAAHERFQEEIAAMKSTLSRLRDEGEKHAQEVKDEFKIIKEKSVEYEKLKNELKALSARLDTMKQTTGDEIIAIPAMSEPKDIPMALRNVFTKMPIEKSDKTISNVCPKTTTGGARRRTSRPSTGNKSTKKSQNVANIGSRKSRRQAHQEPSPTPPLIYVPLPEYPLDQDNMPLDMFVHRIDGISATVAPELQRELAGMFITGLARREEQDAMVAVLSDKHMARVFGDGRVEIYCDWRDMRKVLVGVGLVTGVEEDVVQKRSGRK